MKAKNIPLIIIPIIIIILIFLFYLTNREQSINNTVNISNFSALYHDVPQNKIDTIQQSLQNTITNNYSGDLAHLDATVRTNYPFLYTFDNHLNIHYGYFMVDIPDIQQSYLIQFEWTSEQYEDNLSGYSVLVTCPPKDAMIYPDFSCSDILTSQGG